MSDHESNGETGEFQYKQPPQKSINELLNSDKEDESLKLYKAKLLGQGNVIIDENNPHRVIMRSVEMQINEEGNQTVTAIKVPNNFSGGSVSDLVMNVKEGSNYQLKFKFHVQREIASGLHYKHKVKRSGITVENEKFMMGSYAPKLELQEYLSPAEDAPTGMIHRGKYKVHSKITDDDGHVYLDWQWVLVITKD